MKKDKALQHTKHDRNRNQRRRKLGPNMMFYLSCFLMVSNNPTLGAENVTTVIETNKINKNAVKPKHQYGSEEQRLTRRHIADSFIHDRIFA